MTSECWLAVLLLLLVVVGLWYGRRPRRQPRRCASSRTSYSVAKAAVAVGRVRRLARRRGCPRRGTATMQRNSRKQMARRWLHGLRSLHSPTRPAQRPPPSSCHCPFPYPRRHYHCGHYLVWFVPEACEGVLHTTGGGRRRRLRMRTPTPLPAASSFDARSTYSGPRPAAPRARTCRRGGPLSINHAECRWTSSSTSPP